MRKHTCLILTADPTWRKGQVSSDGTCVQRNGQVYKYRETGGGRSHFVSIY